MKYPKNIYFAYRIINDEMDYRILINVDENNKGNLYKTEQEGFKITKILANERGL